MKSLLTTDPKFEKLLNFPTLTLFQPCFFWLSVTGNGWIPSPRDNNVTVALGQGNSAHICTGIKTTSVPNLDAIAQLLTSL